MKTACYKMARPLIFMLLIMMGALFLSTDSVGASTILTPTSASWEIPIDFENDQLNANWIVRLWADDGSGGEILIMEEVTPLKCVAHGGVTIATEKASFDGVDDYFTCKVPSFADKVSEMSGGMLTVEGNPAECSLCKDPWAEVNAEPEFSSPDIGNPVYSYHPYDGSGYANPEVQFFIPSTNSEEFQTRFVLPDIETRSPSISSVGLSDRLRSEHECSGYGCAFTNLRNGALLNDEPTPFIDPMSLNQAILYIGHSRPDHTFFRGFIEKGNFDPGCRI